MRTALRLFVMATAAFAAAGSTALLAADAAPRLHNGKPDLSGHWANPYTPNMATKGSVLDPATRKPLNVSGAELPDAKAAAIGGGKRTLDLPYTEWGLKRWKS